VALTATVRSSALRYRKGRIRVTVRCAARASCRGTLNIRKGKVAIGSQAYRVRAGASAIVSVKPCRRGRRALATRRRDTVTVELKPSTGDVVSRKLTLRR
jgi:hypothetical protein